MCTSQALTGGLPSAKKASKQGFHYQWIPNLESGSKRKEMKLVERLCLAVRYIPWLERADWLWDLLRPHYEKLVGLMGQHGLPRNINGTDQLLILPRWREVRESYEPDVWKTLMGSVLSGDTIADVGAFIGLYTIALAKRVGHSGKVVAFEPDPENFASLRSHVELNRVSDRVELVPTAVAARNGVIPFKAGRASGSHVSPDSGQDTHTVPCVRLDTKMADRRVDILKIDVEGYELEVLEGAIELLQNIRCCPRSIFLEVHPFLWSDRVTTGKALLDLLVSANYQVVGMNGQPVKCIEFIWGHVVAIKKAEREKNSKRI